MVVYTAAQPPKASIFESELARCTKMLCDGGIPKRSTLKRVMLTAKGTL